MSFIPSDSSSSSTDVNYCLDEKVNNLSPVTDLAFNLKSLKTITGTPTRRISWSDPFPNDISTKCLSDLSLTEDSPMLQEIFRKNAKKVKSSTARRMLPLYLDTDKENIHPDVCMKSSGVISRNSSVLEMEKNSQDSGYSSNSSKKQNSLRRTPFRIRSFTSITNTKFEDIDCMFPVEDDVDMEPASEFSMKSLLTKPLCNISNNYRTVKRYKLPIRRCLTMEMDDSSDSSSVRLDSSTQSGMPFTSDKNDSTDVNMEPLKKLPIKRPDQNTDLSLQNKRRKSSPSISISDDDKSRLLALMKKRSFSETATTIMQAVQKADLQPELIGDCSRNYALPLIKGRHQDLKCISSETLVKLINGDYYEKIDSYTLVDCRYPYEYEGGHIQGAENIYTKEDIIERFLGHTPEQNIRNIVIFHCEFSSERAPNLCRFLRNKDREVNECNYPKLHHPEIYILDGGYKAFYANFQEYCVPQKYKPMNHKDHSSDLRFFRAKSKSFGSDSKLLYKMKSCSENSNA